MSGTGEAFAAKEVSARLSFTGSEKGKTDSTDCRRSHVLFHSGQQTDRKRETYLAVSHV